MMAYCAFGRTKLEEEAPKKISRLYGAAGIQAINYVRIIKECKGTFVRLDARRQRALMRVRFDGVKREIPLSANILLAD